MSEFAIEVDNVSKVYYPDLKLKQSLSDSINDFFKRKNLNKIEVKALNDVTFKVKKGEVLGIVGDNGSGKSTLLKILSRITEPTSGNITINGKLMSILEIGTGFHPDLTGRENIYFTAEIYGMTAKEISQKEQSIIDFSELGDFLDIPVKQYSSGMFMRLAFSIVIHLDANIILLDEVFSVGDVSFREKCNKKILNLKNTGATILFVSHDITSVSQLCSKILLIDDGKVIDINTNETILKKYIEHGFCKKNNATDVSLFKVVKSFEIYTYTYTITEFKSKEIKCPIILKLFNSDLDGNFNCNNEFIIGLEYKKSEDSNYLVPIINLKYYLSSNMDISFNPLIYNESFKVNFISELSINVFCKIPPHFLNSGLFFISLFFIDENSKSVLQFENFASFKISYNKDSLKSIFYDGNFSGAVTPRVEWEIF